MLKREATPDQVFQDLKKRTLQTVQSVIPFYLSLLHRETDGALLPLPLPVVYSSAEAGAMLAQGTPLLHGAEGVLVQEPMRDVWLELCNISAPYLKAQAEQLSEARRWPETNAQAWVVMMEEYLRSGKAQAESVPDRNLSTFLLVHTWRPFLLPWARELAPLLEGTNWQRGCCPVCGGQPDFAYLSEESGERHLVCARCDTIWRYKRLGCPFCDNWDAASYGYYTDQAGVYRLYACKECSRYLKVLDLRRVDGERLLMAERIASIEIDMAALEAGYQSA